MTGDAGIDALIGFAVAVLVVGLLVIAGLAKAARPKGRGLQLEAAYRRFSTSADPPAVDAEEVDPAATETEKADTGTADPDLDDTVEIPPVLAGPGLTAVRRGSAFPSRLRDAGLITACTQPACTGTIVDAYCDVCGSPAGAVPFVSAGQRLQRSHRPRPPSLA